ncbi:C-type lectin domain family 4 member E-like [Symphorus nematophorus]
MERDRLRVDITNLTSEKDRLQNYSYSVVESYNETKNVNRNLTRKIHQLENENNLLTDIKNNLTIERDDLLEQIAETSCCPDYWIRFGKSCYFISTSSKNWSDSKKFCKDRDAHLVIISNDEEQKFVSSLKQRVWIGLTDEETEGVWKWVDGTEVTKKYWGNKQPDNAGKGEHCVEIYTVFGPFKNWNDMRCWTKSNFICEKILG